MSLVLCMVFVVCRFKLVKVVNCGMRVDVFMSLVSCWWFCRWWVLVGLMIVGVVGVVVGVIVVVGVGVVGVVGVVLGCLIVVMEWFVVLMLEMWMVCYCLVGVIVCRLML